MYKVFSTLLLALILCTTFVYAQEAELPGKDKAGNEIEQVVPVSVMDRVRAYENNRGRALLNEGFESGVIPINWTILNEDGGTKLWSAYSSTTYANTGSYSARIQYESSSLDNDDWLITPPLDIQAGVSDTLKFWVRTYSNSYSDSFEVRLSTSGPNAADFTTMLYASPGNMGTYQQLEFPLDAYDGQIVYVAIRYLGQYDWYVYADDFEGPEVYVPPIGVFTTPFSEINMNETYGGVVQVGEFASDYIYITNTGGGDLNITGINTSSADINTSVSSLTIGPGATDSVAVTWTPSAGGMNTGWVEFVSDASSSPDSVDLTLHSADPNAFVVDFEADVSLWRNPGVYGFSINSTLGYTGINQHWGDQGYWKSGTTGSDTTYFVSPRLDLTSGPTEVGFYYKGSSTGNDDTVEVVITTDNGATWTQLGKVLNNNTTFQYQTYDLSAYAGNNNVKIGWHYYYPSGSTSGGSWYMDDVVFPSRYVEGTGTFYASLDNIDFGTTLLGDTSTAVVILSNSGSPLNITAVSSDNSEFVVSDLVPPVALGTFETDTLLISYIPTMEGPTSGNITISHDGQNGMDTDLIITVSGEGFDPIVSSFPYEEAFENGGSIPAGWFNDDMDSGKDWEFTTSAGHGAGYDHTSGSGYFAYVDDSTPNPTDPTNLLSPPFNLNSLTSPELVFWYWSYMDGGTADQGWMHVDVYDGSVWHLDVIDSIGSEAEEWRQKTVDLTPYKSSETVVRFRYLETTSFYHDVGIDDFKVWEAPTMPIFGVSPDTVNFGAIIIGNTSAPEVVTVKNIGAGTLTIDPAISITGTDPGDFTLVDNNTYPVNLLPDSTMTVEVSFAPQSGGIKSAMLTITDNTARAVQQVPLFGDGFDPVVHNFPFSEGFENNGDIPPGWINDDMDSGKDWEFGTSTTYGAEQDHTSGSGYLAYVDDSTPNPTDPTNLLSRPFELSGLVNPTMEFWYWSFNERTTPQDTAYLHIDVFDGTVWHLDVVDSIGQVAKEWRKATVNLTAYKSSATQVRFRVVETPSFYHDIGIDDVMVYDQINWANLQWPPSTSTEPGVPTENIYGQVWIDGVTNQGGATPGLVAEVGYGPDGSLPFDAATGAANPAWTWFSTTFNVDVGNNDEFLGQITANDIGIYDYAYRYSWNGAPWLYADLDGISNGYDVAQAGDLSVMPQSPVVISEIMYNPEPNSDSYYEYVEIANVSLDTVDVSNYSFLNGFSYVFPAGTKIAAGEYLVVALNPDSVANYYGITNVVGPFSSGSLSNSGELVVLGDAGGAPLDTVDYDDFEPWPVAADGYGPSMELVDLLSDNNVGENWHASLQLDGTPGSANQVAGTPTAVTIHDIQYTTDPSGDSPYANQIVEFNGTVTDDYFVDGGIIVQDSVSTWNGVQVFSSTVHPPVGSEVHVYGSVTDKFGQTRVVGSIVTTTGMGTPLPPIIVTPAMVKTGAATAEAYEGVLVEVNDVVVSNPNAGFGEWEVANATDTMKVDNGNYTYTPVAGDSLLGLRGVMNYSFDEFKVVPRSDDDIEKWYPAGPAGLIAGSGNDGFVPLNWLPAGAFFEGFESGIPSDWQVWNLGTNTSGLTWEATNGDAVEGQQSAWMPYGDPGEFQDEWLVSGPVEIMMANQLHFYQRANYPSYDTDANYLMVSTTGAPGSFTAVDSFAYWLGNLPSDWTEFTVDLSAYQGQTIYLAWQYQSTWGEDWFIDAVYLSGSRGTRVAVNSTPVKASKLLQNKPLERDIVHPTPVKQLDNKSGLRGSGATRALLGYNIYRSETPGVIVDPANLLATVDDTTLSYVDIAVTNFNTYYYKVTAAWEEGESLPSNEADGAPYTLSTELNSPELVVIPTIDGVINTGEWDDADFVYGTLNGIGGTIHVKNDGQYLYIAFDHFADMTLNDFDQVGLYFDANNDGLWAADSSEGNYWLLYDAVNDTMLSQFRGWKPDFTTSDPVTPAAGVVGDASFLSGHMQYEVQIDLTVANFNTTPGDTAGIYAYLLDNAGGVVNGQWPETAVFSDPSTFGALSTAMPAMLPPLGLTAQSGNDGFIPLGWLPAGTFFEGFEFGIPADWQIWNLGSNTTGNTWEATTNDAYEGSQSAWMPYGAQGEFQDEWLVSGPVTVDDMNQLHFFHWADFADYDTDPNYLLISMTGAAGTFTAVDSFLYTDGTLPSEWTEVVVDLSAYQGSTIYLAWQYQSTWGEDWYIDAISMMNSRGENVAVNIVPASSSRSVSEKPKTRVISHRSPVVQLDKISGFNSTEEYRALGYKIYRSQTPNFNISPLNLLASVGDTATTYVDNNVTNLESYYYKVTAEYAGGESVPSNEALGQAYVKTTEFASVFTDTVPTIDGVINPDEWAGASMFYTTDNGLGGQVYVMNNDGYIFIGVHSLVDSVIDDFDQCGIYFDNNNDDMWAADGSEGNYWIYTETGSMVNEFRPWLPDTTTGTVVTAQGIISAISNASGMVEFEIQIDRSVANFSPPADDTTGIYVYLQDNVTGAGGLWPETAIFNSPSSFGDMVMPPYVAIEDPDQLPTVFAIYQNYPNPFNPVTTIKYEIPRSVDVEIIVYNLLGQKVRTLVNEKIEPGRYKVEWDGRNNFGNQVATGLYIYRIKAGDFVKSQKMILMK